MKCDRCSHEWRYGGRSTYYATCPNCHRNVKIKQLTTIFLLLLLVVQVATATPTIRIEKGANEAQARAAINYIDGLANGRCWYNVRLIVIHNYAHYRYVGYSYATARRIDLYANGLEPWILAHEIGHQQAFNEKNSRYYIHENEEVARENAKRILNGDCHQEVDRAKRATGRP